VSTSFLVVSRLLGSLTTILPPIFTLHVCDVPLKEAGFLSFDQISVKVENQKLVIEMLERD
jgi:hypothetical protein